MIIIVGINISTNICDIIIVIMFIICIVWFVLLLLLSLLLAWVVLVLVADEREALRAAQVRVDLGI